MEEILFMSLSECIASSHKYGITSLNLFPGWKEGGGKLHRV